MNNIEWTRVELAPGTCKDCGGEGYEHDDNGPTNTICTPCKGTGRCCPYCGGSIDAEYVDIGVGFEQVTPFQCLACFAVQFNPYHDNSKATDEEKSMHWYRGPDESSRPPKCKHADMYDMASCSICRPDYTKPPFDNVTQKPFDFDTYNGLRRQDG